jgi:16S rRNA C967 or C1407 C5-methylase (RsmB/RsmF family)
LAGLQRQLLDGAITLLRPGGQLFYSVCTLTGDETVGIDDWLAARHPELHSGERLGSPWSPAGRGVRLLPQTAGTDGMFLLALTRS